MADYDSKNFSLSLLSKVQENFLGRCVGRLMALDRSGKPVYSSFNLTITGPHKTIPNKADVLVQWMASTSNFQISPHQPLPDCSVEQPEEIGQMLEAIETCRSSIDFVNSIVTNLDYRLNATSPVAHIKKHLFTIRSVLIPPVSVMSYSNAGQIWSDFLHAPLKPNEGWDRVVNEALDSITIWQEKVEIEVGKLAGQHPTYHFWVHHHNGLLQIVRQAIDANPGNNVPEESSLWGHINTSLNRFEHLVNNLDPVRVMNHGHRGPYFENDEVDAVYWSNMGQSKGTYNGRYVECVISDDDLVPQDPSSV